MSDCSVIVCGDIGMGFYKLNYYIDIFKSMNKKLAKKNIQLYFIRGNHDNPDYFNCIPEELMSFSHVHLVRDYTVLHLLAVGLHHLLAGLEHRGHTRTHPVLGQLHKRSRQTHGRRLRLATLLRLRRLLDFIAMRLRVELPHDMDHDGFLLRLR